MRIEVELPKCFQQSSKMSEEEDVTLLSRQPRIKGSEQT
jgi:hypothetical protein